MSSSAAPSPHFLPRFASGAICATRSDVSIWTWNATKPLNIGSKFAPAGSWGVGRWGVM